MHQPPHGSDILSHDGVVLILLEGVHAEDIEGVGDGAGAGAPFAHLGGREVVRGEDVAGSVAADDEAREGVDGFVGLELLA